MGSTTMSTQAVTEFLEQLANDDDLKAELELKGTTRQERIVATVEFAGKRGCDFTEDECAAVLETVQKVRDGELDEAELETVAGGAYEPNMTVIRMTAAVQGFMDWLCGDDEDGDGEEGDTEPHNDTGTAVAGIRG